MINDILVLWEIKNGNYVRKGAFKNTPENVTNAIMSSNEDKMLVNIMDMNVLDTFGTFVNRQTLSNFKDEILPLLIEKQSGSKPVGEVEYITDQEYAEGVNNS